MASSPKKVAPPPAFVHEPAYVEEPTPMAPVEPVATPSVVEAPAFAPTPVVAKAEPFKAVTAKAFEAPMASLQNMQEKARALVEKGIVESRANYAKLKTSADETSSAIEASYGAAKSGVIEFNVKAIEALKASADANFDFFKSLASAKSMSEYVTLHTEFTRKQFEAASTQSKELASLARKVADETVAPFKAHVSKAFKVAV